MLGQVVITKELIGEDTLYFTYSVDYDMYVYYCKSFLLWEDYFVIEKNIQVKKGLPFSFIEDMFDINGEIEDFAYKRVFSEPYFKISNGQKYAMYRYYEVTYKIPFKFYKNIIKKLGCFVLVFKGNDYNSTIDKPLVLIDKDNAVIGCLFYQAFEIEFSRFKENVKYIFRGDEI